MVIVTYFVWGFFVYFVSINATVLLWHIFYKWLWNHSKNLSSDWYPVQVTSYFTFFFLKNVWQKCIFPSSFWGICLLNYLDYLFFYTTNYDMLISSPKEDVKKVARKAGVRSGGWQNEFYFFRRILCCQSQLDYLAHFLA